MSKEKKLTLNDILKIVDKHLQTGKGCLFISLDPYELVDICQRLGRGYTSKIFIRNSKDTASVWLSKCDIDPWVVTGTRFSGAIFSSLTEKDLKDMVKSSVNYPRYGSSNAKINKFGTIKYIPPQQTYLDFDTDNEEDEDPWTF